MKKIIEISAILLVTFVIVSLSANAIYGSTETLSSKNYTSSLGGETKSCVTGATYIFPFWKRVCTDCSIHFTDFGTRSTCSKGSTE